MSKLALASKLADELGSSVDDAMRWIDDVGADKARRLVDETAEAGSRTVENWWKPATAVGGISVGGALAWRQQDLWRAQAIAEQKQSVSEAAKQVLNSDLPTDKKRKLLDEMLASINDAGDGGGGGGDEDDGPLAWLEKNIGSMQGKVLALIVLLATLNYALGGE